MKKYLIVVDMQKDFVDGALGTPEAQAIVEKVVEKIHTWDGQILVTLDTHGPDYMQTREGRFLPVPHCISGMPGHGLDARVAAALKDKQAAVLEKPTFGSVRLPELVAGAEYVELVGLCTDICVVSNALLLKAAYPEMDIAVDAACCAGVTVDSHNAALTTMKMCQVQILNA